jgi:hypothetical protein
LLKRLSKDGLEEAVAFGMGGGELGFQLIAEGHEFNSLLAKPDCPWFTMFVKKERSIYSLPFTFAAFVIATSKSERKTTNPPSLRFWKNTL